MNLRFSNALSIARGDAFSSRSRSGEPLPVPWLRSRQSRSCKGFSLIESTLAIGVVAFSFVAILGLLPAGLTTFRKAMDASVGAEIGQRVLNDLQQSDFNTLLSQTSNPDLPATLRTVLSEQSNGAAPARMIAGIGYLPHRFFDDQGNEVVMPASASSTPADPTPTKRATAHILYDVHTQIVLTPQIPSKVNGNGADGFLESPSLANVVIQIFSNPGGVNLPDDLTPSQTRGAQSVYVAGAGTNVPFTTYTGLLSQNSRPAPASASGS
jgi:type II secretory pathway pseudopilin PulG